MAVQEREVQTGGTQSPIVEHHAPWDCKDWECAEHVNTASHSLWPPPSTPADVKEAQRLLANRLERMWWDLFGKDRSDMGKYYSPSMRDRATSRRLYMAVQRILKEGVLSVEIEGRREQR